MKTSFTFAIAFILNITIVYSQQLKINSIAKANHSSYKVNSATSKLITAVRENNIYYNRIPKNRNPDLTVIKSDSLSLINSFTKVFSNHRLQQLLPERNIILTFYVSPLGKVLEVSFILRENTLVTATELEALEDALKANVRFKIDPDETRGSDFIDISQNIFFRKILDKTLR